MSSWLQVFLRRRSLPVDYHMKRALAGGTPCLLRRDTAAADLQATGERSAELFSSSTFFFLLEVFLFFFFFLTPNPHPRECEDKVTCTG